MHRRTLLGVAALTALSGCLGYEIQSTDDIEESEQHITELSGRVESLEGDLNGSESQIESLEEEIASIEAQRDELGTTNEELADQIEALESQRDELETANEDLENEIEAVESQLADARVDHVVTFYEEGDQARQFGNGAWSNGVEVWNESNYTSATGFFGRAYSDYGRAEDILEAAADAMNEHGVEGQNGILDDAISKMEAYKEASFSMENAAYYLAVGDTETASTYYADSQDYVDEADGYEMAAVDEFRSAIA